MRIFLSYGHDPFAALAVRLKQDLEARGHAVWFDQERLLAGRDWEEYIADGLDWVSAEPGGKLVLLITPHSVRRPDGFCLNELARALARRLPIIPVMVSTAEPPLSICRLQWLEMRDCLPVEERPERYAQQFEKLLQALLTGEIPGEGEQARLLSFLEPIDFQEEIDRHLKGFEGREWVLTEIDRWLAAPDPRRVFWITGAAGVGKTALAAWLTARRPELAAFHFCRFGHAERTDPATALRSLAFQLGTQLPDFRARLNGADIEGLLGETNPRAIFQRLFVNLLSGLTVERPVVLLIDALDEATAHGRNELAALIGSEFSRTPPWLRLIVTSRPHEQPINFALQALDPWMLRADSPRNLDDIRAFLSAQLPAADRPALEAIVEKSEGLFLYVRWVCQEIQDGRQALDRPDQFPQGLGGIYAHYFERQFPDREVYQTSYRPVLEAVCAAREPLELDQLALLFGWTVYQKEEIGAAFGSLFPVAAGRIQPFHQSVRDWLTDRNRAGAFFISTAGGERRLADFGWRSYQAGVDSIGRYSILHLASHLAALPERVPDLRQLLFDPRWIAAKLQVADVPRVIGDFRLLPGDRAVQLVGEALQLAAHVVSQDRLQFASQMVGRLLPHKGVPEVQRFLDSVAEAVPRPWIRPLFPALSPPGTALVRTLEGHSGMVKGVALSADGRLAVSASADKTLKVWDLSTGEEVLTLSGHLKEVDGVALSRDGRRAVSASWDRTLKVWDLSTGEVVRTLEGHSGGVTGVALSGDGRWAVSASADKTLKVWDLFSGEAVRTLEGHSGWVTGVALSGDGRRAVSASSDWTLKVWDLSTGEAVRTLEGHSNSVGGVALSGDGGRAVSASADGTLKVWDLSTGEEVRALKGHWGMVEGIALSGDGGRAISASWDQTLKVWDLATGEAVRTLTGHSFPVVGVALSVDGLRAVSASCDGTLKVWGLSSGEVVRGPAGHSLPVNGVALNGDGSRAVSASQDDRLKVWDLSTGEAIRWLECHLFMASGVALSGDGGRAVSASWEQTLQVWDLSTGEEVHWLLGHSAGVGGVALSVDGGRAVSASADKTLKVWDLATGEAIRTLEGHSGEVHGVALSRDGRWAVSASADKTLKVWDLSTGEEVLTLSGHLDEVHGVALSRDGRWAVSASADQTLKVWDLSTGEEVLTLSGHLDEVTGVALSRDGRRAISASADQTLKVWNLSTGLPIATFFCDAAVLCCACAPPNLIVAGDRAGQVHFLALEE